MKKLEGKKQVSAKRFGKLVLPLLFVSLLSVSCGSSGGSGNASGGIGGTGISKGTISGFSSVIVNGVRFNTDNATFTVDDNPGAQDNLAVGMVVAVQGTVNADGTTGQATHVEFEEEVKGPIDGRDPINKSLVVLGRTVIVDDSTKIENDTNPPLTLSFADLGTNDIVEVSGLIFSDDRIQATYIKKKTEPFIPGVTEVELKGIVKTLNDIATTFAIAGQTINYSAAIFERMTLSDLQNGVFVEVKGTRDGSNILNAETIQREDGALGANENEYAELEGLVTAFTSSAAFSVNGQAISTSSSTLFEDGAADDIAENVRLEVEGNIVGGILVATKVKFHGNRIKIEADVENIDTAANTVTLLGKVVLINGSTDMDDKTSNNAFAFSDISLDDRLEIRAYLSNGIITATRVEREDPDSKVLLQAPVDLVSDPDLILLGVTVKGVNAIFKNRLDVVISIGDFFSQVKAGDLVKTKGTLINGEILAEEVEFETEG